MAEADVANGEAGVLDQELERPGRASRSDDASDTEQDDHDDHLGDGSADA
jgi:hypothetical protein